MEQPIIFLGWGGEHSTDAIFSVCPEYISNRTIAIIFDDKRLASGNETTQEKVGSGFSVEKIIPDNNNGEGVIQLNPDCNAIKRTITIGRQERLTKEIGCEYAIAFHCRGEFLLRIIAIREDNRVEVLYTRSFCCK